ncbi:MAG: MerR family transcriptional regulator [Chlorobiales bacterium]|nr:MerR family transcriptional regulator [Chlorobiales bacterium]
MPFESNKSYYSIGEVSRITGVPAYLLRYWENFFNELNPGRDTRDNRRYTNKDIAMVLTIKDLVYEKGYKLEKASQIVKGGRVDTDSDEKTEAILKLQKQMGHEKKNHAITHQRRKELLEDIKEEIEKVLQMLG